jgi:choline dehydrogenase-like flavoprotein
LLDGPCVTGEHLTSRDALREAIRAEIATTFHPSTTCKMGPARDPLSVVDFQGRVRGLGGLRVCDAAIFPFGPTANLHFTVVAVAEKIAAGMVR